LSFFFSPAHTQTLNTRTNDSVSKESERQAEKKQAEAVQLEQRMNEMEKAMMDLEQRFVIGFFSFLML